MRKSWIFLVTLAAAISGYAQYSPPVASGGTGDASAWSTYAAQSDVNLGGNTISNGVFVGDGSGLNYSVYDAGATGADVTFNFANGQFQKIGQSDTVTNTSYSVADYGKAYEMVVEVNWTNGASWTWDTNQFQFIGGSVPTLTSNAWNTLFFLYRPTQSNVLVGLAQ